MFDYIKLERTMCYGNCPVYNVTVDKEGNVKIDDIIFLVSYIQNIENKEMRNNTMNDKEIYRLHAEFCKFMANPKRIEIMFLLGDEELCVDDIAEKMEVRVANISQHLSVMREKGVVVTRREGTKIYYRIANPKTLEACTIMRDAMIEHMKKNINIINKI